MSMGPRNHALDGSTHPPREGSAARGHKTAMRTFSKLLWTLVKFHSDTLNVKWTLFIMRIYKITRGI